MSPYTEIRIAHKTKHDKEDYEARLDMALIIKGYANRTTFLREVIRELTKGENRNTIINNIVYELFKLQELCDDKEWDSIVKAKKLIEELKEVIR